MSNVSHFVTSDNTTLDIVAKTGRGLIRATMESTSTSTAFVASADGVTELYDGLTIVLKNTKAASASGCTLKLNTLDAKRIWLSQSNSYCTTHFAKNQTYIFIYDATNSRWELQQGRDTDANTWRGIKVNGTTILGTSTTSGPINFVAGTNVTLTSTALDDRYDVNISASDSTKVSKSGDTMTGDLSFVDGAGSSSQKIASYTDSAKTDMYAAVEFDSVYDGIKVYGTNGTSLAGFRAKANATIGNHIQLYPGNWEWLFALGLYDVFYNADLDEITFNSDTYPCVGYVTSGQKDAYFDITMPKLGNLINTVSVSQFGCAVRLAQGGYLQKSNDSSNMLDGTIKITGTPKFKGNTLSICVNNPNKFIVSGNQSVFVTNNTPFVGYCQLSASFT